MARAHHAPTTSGFRRPPSGPPVAGLPLPGRRAEDVVVPEVRRTITERPRGWEDEVPGVMGLLPPVIHRGTVLGPARVCPHSGSVGPRAYGVHVVTEELVIEDPALGSPSRVSGRPVVEGGPPRRYPV